MSAFRLMAGAAPAGPLAGRIPTGPRYASAAKGTRPPSPRQAGKKGYTGTRAGLGRTPLGTVSRQGPGGPARFPGAVMLPARIAARGSTTTARRPTLYQRIRNRAAGFLGF